MEFISIIWKEGKMNLEKISLRKIEGLETTGLMDWYFLLSMDYAHGMAYLIDMLWHFVGTIGMTLSGIAWGLGNFRLFTINWSPFP